MCKHESSAFNPGLLEHAGKGDVLIGIHHLILQPNCRVFFLFTGEFFFGRKRFLLGVAVEGSSLAA